MNISNIKGNKDLNDMALELYPSALKFYGTKYKETIDLAIKNTILYKSNNADIIGFLTYELKQENIRNIPDLKNSNFPGFYSKSNNLNEPAYIIIKDDSPKIMKHILAHELYGHAVCSEHKPIILHNGLPHIRNGIQFCNTINSMFINNNSNEGLIEYIALNIMKCYNQSNESMSDYKDSLIVATQLFKYIGKDKMLDLLVLNNGNIELLFDEENPNSWKNLSKKLENNNSDFDDDLDSFIKRYKYRK